MALALLIVGVTLNIHKLIAPRRPSPGKVSTYESGEVPIGNARGPIDVQFYMYVITFLILDVEAVFLIPWAVNFGTLPVAAHAAMGIFVALIVVGWLYEWKKGALQWQN
ncbi:MAG TPA: NADH-quinone oxidoreductase subunit A [Candidatus Thermoplasmatota archaeon]|nr:NADH-quinone oxidoreductase subunit A [Candidatus Thermoplasmatota archaeon]